LTSKDYYASLKKYQTKIDELELTIRKARVALAGLVWVDIATGKHNLIKWSESDIVNSIDKAFKVLDDAANQKSEIVI
jgi:hypothetical protein